MISEFLTYKKSSDEVIRISDEYSADPRKNKLNLWIWVFKQGWKLFVHPEVMKYQVPLNSWSIWYLNTEWLNDFLQVSQEFIFWDYDAPISSIATNWGTWWLYLMLLTLKNLWYNNLLLPSPTYLNYEYIYNLVFWKKWKINKFPHISIDWTVDIKSYIEAIHSCEDNSILLLQWICHNPTWINLSQQELSKVVSALQRVNKNWKKIMVILDIAYFWLWKWIDQDRERHMKLFKWCANICITFSYSKIATIYALRTGCLLVKCEDDKEKDMLDSNLRLYTRDIVLHAPILWQKIVTELLSNKKTEFIQWINYVKDELNQRRSTYFNLVWKNDFWYWYFTQVPLSFDQIESLKQDKWIYLLSTWRLNFWALQSKNDILMTVNAILDSV